MKAPETSIAFAGIDNQTKTDLPEWYRTRQDVDDVTTFAEAIRNLP